MIGRFTADRMLYWGVVLGIGLATVQLMSLPLIGVFSPIKEVQIQARYPSIVG